MTWSHQNPVGVHFGQGVARKAGGELPHGKALVVTGRSSTRTIFEQLLSHWQSLDFCWFDGVEENPSIQTTEKGISLFRDEKCDYVIGIGGGSPLDCGKAIALLANSCLGVADVLHKRATPSGKGVPFVAIPTTSGTGSEVTPYSIITDTSTRKKISIATPLSYPLLAIVDPDLTLSMPPKTTAATGLDVLAHAIESAWSNVATGLSIPLAIEAARLTFENLPSAFMDGANSQARENMMLASMLAGKAISVTGTTINHSISYPLTLHRDLAHGFACAISLPAAMRYNLDASRPVLDRMARACGSDSAQDLPSAIEGLLTTLKAPSRLEDLGIGEKDLDWLTEESYGKNAARNPRAIEKKDMKSILKTML